MLRRSSDEVNKVPESPETTFFPPLSVISSMYSVSDLFSAAFIVGPDKMATAVLMTPSLFGFSIGFPCARFAVNFSSSLTDFSRETSAELTERSSDRFRLLELLFFPIFKRQNNDFISVNIPAKPFNKSLSDL